MKRTYLIFILFQALSIKVNAQQGTLLHSDSLQHESDSLGLFTMPIEDSYSNNSELPYRICLPPPYQITNWSNIEKDSLGNFTSIADSSQRISAGFPSGIMVPSFSDIDWSKIMAVSFKPESCYNAKGAKKDLKEGRAQILFHGGFGGMPDFESEKDQEFQKKYHLEFFSQGCSRYGENENEEAYNAVIFDYLDQTYGTEWRNELRHDAIGFKTPPTSHSGTAIKLSPPSEIQIGNQENAAKRGDQSSKKTTSVWWYILPISGFVLLFSVYFIRRQKNQ